MYMFSIDEYLSMTDLLQVKYLPEWFPGASFKGEAKRMRTDLMRACERPYGLVKKEVASRLFLLRHFRSPKYLRGQCLQEAGIYKNSFSHELLSEPNLDHYQRELIKWSAITMYFGGSDTVSPQPFCVLL
jgi:hypothetical protein